MRVVAAKRSPRALFRLASLVFIVLVACYVAFPLQQAQAVDIVDSGSIDLGGTVPGPPPTTAAVITTPTNGQHFNQTLITVGGTCPVTTTVEIYKNNIFAGSVSCDAGGHFALQIDLLQGENRLLARVHDSLDQYGPDSNIVTVYYDVPTPSGGGSSGGGSVQPIPQMLILVNSIYQGQNNSRPLKIDIEITGGEAPYALSIDWGDGTNELLSRPNGSKFTVEHLYKTPGIYKVTIKGTDSVGSSSYIQISGVVNGPIYKTFDEKGLPKNKLAQVINILFIIMLIIFALISTFWAGKRWEFHELEEEERLKPEPKSHL